MRKRFWILFLPLLLSGCLAEAIATAINDGRALHEAVYGFVRENHEARREVRRMCQRLLQRQVEVLAAAGSDAEAAALLKRNYPDLVTVGVVKRLLEDGGDVTAQPFGCETLTIVEEEE